MSFNSDWRNEYRDRRYMEELDRDELIRRAGDIFCNFPTLTDETKLGMLAVEGNGRILMRAWTHVLEEFRLRGLPIAEAMDSTTKARIPRPDHPQAAKATALMKEAGLLRRDSRPLFAKFGKAQFMKALVEVGAIRVFPARHYRDPSLNTAIQDDELVIEWGLPGEDLTIQPLDRVTREPTGPPVPLEGQVKGEWRLPTNFYAWCFTQSLDGRLFQDFESDACVVIADYVQFFNRLAAAMSTQLPKWQPIGGPVEYVDPLEPPQKPPTIFFSKHLRYSYQRESRIVWFPPSRQGDLEPIDVELGSLRDCCRLFLL